jgi:hypothetical protein
MIKVPPQIRNSIEILLQKLISDLGSSTPIAECGWVSKHDMDTNILLGKNSPFCYNIQIKHPKGIRLKIIDDKDPNNLTIPYSTKQKIDEHFSQLSRQLDYLISLRNEDYRLTSSHQIIRKTFEGISKSAHSSNLAIFCGLYRMLENSGLPAPMIKVFEANLNPKEWNQLTTNSIPYLTSQLVHQINPNFSLSMLTKKPEKVRTTISVENFSTLESDLNGIKKVEEILRWNQIISNLDSNTLSCLGLNWYILDLLENDNLIPSDQKSLVEVHNTILTKIESLLKVKFIEIFSRYDKFVGFCESENIPWGSEIFSFPEVI